MVRIRFALAAIVGLAASLAHAAGFQRIEVPASGVLPLLKGAVWYPCAEPTSDLKLGPFVLSVTKDCPVTGEKLPLVVISHGRTGSYLGHRDTAEALANAGFVVVAVNHPGDNATDKGRTDDFGVFIERPTDVKRVVDFMLGAWPDAAKIDAGRVGIFGFSRGGYTGLVAIGATLSSSKLRTLCEGVGRPDCDEVRNAPLPKLVHDPRIKAAVIADPFGGVLAADSFRDVRAPVQLWASERGGDGVSPENVAAIASWLPAKPEFHSVPNSQHFAFLAPCPEDLAKSAPEICADAPGFDRAAFHQQFNADVLAFFRAHLMDAQPH
jgi:predicted dienelactone hydrolase